MSVSEVAIRLPVADVGATVPPVGATGVRATSGATAAVTTSTNSTVTHISQASLLMSRLNQLATEDPAKFKSVTNTIASGLAQRAAVARAEYSKRAELQAELAQVQRDQGADQVAFPGSQTASTQNAIISVFTAASQSGTLGTNAGTTAAAWAESGLATGLTEALSLVDEALGIAA
jgi:hypothetical protein